MVLSLKDTNWFNSISGKTTTQEKLHSRVLGIKKVYNVSFNFYTIRYIYKIFSFKFATSRTHIYFFNNLFLQINCYFHFTSLSGRADTIWMLGRIEQAISKSFNICSLHVCTLDICIFVRMNIHVWIDLGA